uniref:Centromere protein M n=1 Tax=Saimiri boliviensis boliviensis TaxID=39432 RepID=A0A2K6UDU5_SAIBB
MLKEDCASELKVHLAKSLPLPSSVNRPRIDLIVFVVNLHSKYRIREARASAFSVVKFCSLVCFLTLAWSPQPPEHRGVPAPCGCLLLGEGVFPRHRRWTGEPLQHSPAHHGEAGPHLPEPPALL